MTLQDKSFDGSSSFGSPRFLFTFSPFILFCNLYNGFHNEFSFLNFINLFATSGLHENIVGYYSSWFENERLYIQMELCDHSLSIRKYSALFTEGQVLDALFQVCFSYVYSCRVLLLHKFLPIRCTYILIFSWSGCQCTAIYTREGNSSSRCQTW